MVPRFNVERARAPTGACPNSAKRTAMAHAVSLYTLEHRITMRMAVPRAPTSQTTSSVAAQAGERPRRTWRPNLCSAVADSVPRLDTTHSLRRLFLVSREVELIASAFH